MTEDKKHGTLMVIVFFRNIRGLVLVDVTISEKEW